MSLTQLSGRIASFLPSQFRERLRKNFDPRYERSVRVLSYISPKDKVLDVGCVQHTLDDKDWRNPPFGMFLHADLIEHAEETVGIDIVEKEVERMSRAGDDVRIGDAQTFDLDEKFDVIVAGELIEHLENPGQFLDRCREHLSENGTVILTTPNPHNLLFSLWVLRGKHVNDEHTLWLDHDVMETLARRAELTLFEYEFFGPLISAVSMPLYNLGVAKPVTAGGYIFILKRSEST